MAKIVLNIAIALVAMALVVNASCTTSSTTVVEVIDTPAVGSIASATPEPSPITIPPTATRVPAPPTPTPTILPSPTVEPTATAAPTIVPPTATLVPSTATPTATTVPTSTPLPVSELGELPDGVVTAFTLSETLERQPTPTATSFPEPSTPFETPIANEIGKADLQPYFDNGQPVKVRNPNGGPFTKKSDMLVDFYITNAGSKIAQGEYFIDIYIDDHLAQRWGGINLKPDHFIFVEGASGLLDLFDLQPGEHSVKLVIDPTNAVPEISDGDNTYTQTFNWEAEPKPTPSPTDVLPNLSLLGDGTGIRISPFLGAAESGGLSVKGPTTVEFAAYNDSPVTVSEDFALNVWFDGVLVYFTQFGGIIGGKYAHLEWEGLSNVIDITPGEHVIKLVADPTNAIQESDETDNIVELVLTWGTDEPIAAPEPKPFLGAPTREIQILPNLTGVTPYGWDASITASNADFELEPGADAPIWASVDTAISFAIRNSSRTTSATDGEFQALLLVDGSPVESALFAAGGDAGSTWSETLTIPANTVDPGPHFVQLNIDTENSVPEFNESDNSLGRWIEFLDGQPSTAVTANDEISDEDLATMLAPLLSTEFTNQVREAHGSAFELSDWFDEIEQIGRAGFYLLTGKDINNERVVVHILPHDQFIAASYNACMTDYYLWDVPVYVNNFALCSDFRGEIGFKYRQDGKIHVYVDMKESPIQALGTYFHELGHAYQDLQNPAQEIVDRDDELRYTTLRGLHEAQAQAFEAAAMRTIESYLGISLMKYDDNIAMRDFVEFQLISARDQNGSAEHVLGKALLWYEVLANSSGLNLDQELLANKILSGASVKALYDYLVALDPNGIVEWRDSISSNFGLLDNFIEISLSRLETDLPSEEHGNPGLIEPAFLVP